MVQVISFNLAISLAKSRLVDRWIIAYRLKELDRPLMSLFGKRSNQKRSECQLWGREAYIRLFRVPPHRCTAALLRDWGTWGTFSNEKRKSRRNAETSLLFAARLKLRQEGQLKTLKNMESDIYLRHCATLAKVKMKPNGRYFRMKRSPIVCA